MSKKKTVKVKDLVDLVNSKNRKSTCSAEKRAGWNAFLENVLYETGNYEGFAYLSQSDVPEGQEPGIVWVDSERRFPDETRRVYFYKE